VVSEVIKEEVRSEENTEIKGTNKENSNEAEISKVREISKINVTEEMNTDSMNKKSNNEEEYYCQYDIDERDDNGNTPIHIAIH